MNWDRHMKLAAVEACLFASHAPLSAEELAEATQLPGSEIESLLDDLRSKYTAPHSGVQLLEVAGGFQVRTRAEYAEAVEKILQPESKQLSAAAVETLALIAYGQPITRPEIESVRGVNTAHLLRKLEKDGLIEVLGRKDVPGRPKTYGTTSRFLQQFGLSDLDELPPLPEEMPADVQKPAVQNGTG